MNRYLPEENQPEIPPDTCAYINFIQEVLDQIKDQYRSKFLSSQIQLINDTLEYIRESNSALRSSGKYWKKQFENKGKRNK
jgi:hypothetical protein